MAPLIDPKPRELGVSYAYSCQTEIAMFLNRTYYRGRHFLYFTKDYSPSGNPWSSSPAWIYLNLDQAVKRRDYYEPKIAAAKRGLQKGITIACDKGWITQDVKRKLLVEVEELDIEWFRPKIVRLKLTPEVLAESRAVSRPWATFDEYIVDELPDAELETVIESPGRE